MCEQETANLILKWQFENLENVYEMKTEANLTNGLTIQSTLNGI